MSIIDMAPIKTKKTKRCRIIRLMIDGLFNRFDYDFKFDKKDNIGIIIAPNGCGKTTILNFINFLLYPSIDNYEKIKSIPVKRVQCWTNSGTVITYERLEDEYITQNVLIEIQERMENYYKEVIKIKTNIHNKEFIPLIDELLKAGILGGAGKNITLDNFYYRFTYKTKTDFKEVNFLDELNKLYIKNNKSQLKNEESLIVDIQNKVIQKLIYCRECNLEYITTKRTQSKFDNISMVQFISRIIEKSINKQKNMNELEKSKETNNLLSAINNINFLVQAKTEIASLMQTNKKSIQLNKNIDLMQKIFNKRNLVTNKKIIFTQNDGFLIFQDGKEIPLGCLSSGEVNDFALFFRMIFNKYDSPIFLIDEPEISLHIDWQEEIIDYFLKIAKLNKIQIILATHSPNIVNCHYNLILNGNVKVYEKK